MLQYFGGSWLNLTSLVLHGFAMIRHVAELGDGLEVRNIWGIHYLNAWNETRHYERRVKGRHHSLDLSFS